MKMKRRYIHEDKSKKTDGRWPVEGLQLSKRTDRGGEDFCIECHDFGQRIDIIAEQIDENMSEDKVDGIIDALNEMEKEIKSFPTRFDRYAPTDLAFIINAEALMNMAHKRMCGKASRETREVFGAIRSEVEKADPALAKHLVPMCVYRGGICSEPKSCRYSASEAGKAALYDYRNVMGFGMID